MATINLKSEQFKNQIYDSINKSQLPISLVYYIFKEIMENISNTYQVTIKKEIESLKKDNQKQQNKKEKE